MVPHHVLIVFKQSLKCRRGGWSLKWGRGDEEALPWLQKLNTSTWPTLLFPLSPPCSSNSVHWTMTMTSTLPPSGDHSNPWAPMAMARASFCLLYATFWCLPILNLGVFQGRHKGRSYSYTETKFTGLRWPLSILVIFWAAQRWQEGRNPVWNRLKADASVKH